MTENEMKEKGFTQEQKDEERRRLRNAIANEKAMVVGTLFSIYKAFNWADEAWHHAKQSKDSDLLKKVNAWHFNMREEAQKIIDECDVHHPNASREVRDHFKGKEEDES